LPTQYAIEELAFAIVQRLEVTHMVDQHKTWTPCMFKKWMSCKAKSLGWSLSCEHSIPMHEGKDI
jgi:hypothetical protein